MKTSIPTTPMRLPPTVTATSTQIDGSPTEPPTHMGIDQVSFDLLQNQEDRDENQSLHRIDNQNQKRADHAADKGSEIGINAVNPIKNTDEQCVRKPQDRQNHQEHGSQNHRLNTLSGDEIRERPVAESEDMEEVFLRLLRQKGLQNPLALISQLLLLQQNIAGKDKSNDKIGNTSGNSHGHAHRGSQHISHAASHHIQRCGNHPLQFMSR